MAMKYMCVYYDYLACLEKLTVEECGRLFLSMLRYCTEGDEPEFKGNERFLWPMLKGQLDRDREKYEEYCTQNRHRYNTYTETKARPTSPRDEFLRL
jgi:GTPase SAR1 family protein